MMRSVVVQSNEMQLFLVTVASMWLWLVIEVQRLTQSMTQAIHSLPPVDIQHGPII